jgi:hypothetical protein
VNGCVFHGCPMCMGSSTKNTFPSDGRTPADRQINTLERTERLKKAGYEVEEIYEHNVHRFFERETALMERVDQLEMLAVSKLDPNDCLKGGMTLPVSAYRESSPTEVLRLMDFHSMYPAVQAYFAYPKGRPVVYMYPDVPPIKDLFGVVKLKILPPKKLFMPPLACVINGRLVG